MTSTFSRLASFESSLYRVEHLHTAADDGDEEDSLAARSLGASSFSSSNKAMDLTAKLKHEDA